MIQQDLTEQMPVGGYPDHPIAASFPMMEGEAYEEFGADVGVHGLRQAIVLLAHEDALAVLDGRNRQKAGLAKGAALRFRLFDPATDGESPLDFVVSENMRRRHLSASQRAMAAAELLPFYEAEAKARQIAAGEANMAAHNEGALVSANLRSLAKSGDETSQETGFDPAEESQAPSRKNNTGKGKAAAHAAKKMSVGTRNVEAAKKLKESDPKAAEAVKAGKKTLHAAASGKPSAGSKAEEEYAAALERIGKVCGKQQLLGITQGAILRQRKDVIAYAKLKDEKMLAIRALIDQGWSLQKASLYKAKDIEPTHRVVDLADRAAANGGHYYQAVVLISRGLAVYLNIEVKPLKNGKAI